MNKFGYLLASTALAGVLAMPGTVEAQSSKAAGAAQVGAELFGTGDDFGSGANAWVNVPGISTSIKAPHGKELAIDVALLCGAFTQVKAKSKEGIVDTTAAGSRIKARVKIEPDPDGTGAVGFALPGGAGGVTYCDQQLTLSAKLGGIIADLTACVGGNTTGCVLTNEEITIGLKLLNANAFNFFAIDLDSSDTYTLTVQAQLDTCRGSSAVTDTDNSTVGNCIDDGESDAKAFGFITGGSMFVEEVRFVRGDGL